MSLNKLLLIGRLTRDPELRYSAKGTAYVHIGVAVTTGYTHNGEKKEETAFVDVTAFGKIAERVGEGAKKGSPVFVEGRVRTESWDDKQTGQKRSKLGVLAETIRLLEPDGAAGSPRPQSTAPPPKAEPPPPSDGPPPDDDSVPF